MVRRSEDLTGAVFPDRDTYEAVQKRSRYHEEEVQGYELLRRLDQVVAQNAASPARAPPEDVPSPLRPTLQDVPLPMEIDATFVPDPGLLDDPDVPGDDRADYNRDSLPLTSLMIMKHGISLRAASAMLSAFVADKEGDPSQLVSKSKVADEREKMMRLQVRLRNEELASLGVPGLYFDSKKEDGLVKKMGFSSATTKKQEDHYVLIDQPSGKYICHLSAKSPDEVEGEDKKAGVVAGQLIEALKSRGVDTSKLVCLGGDSTKLNTGCNAGIFREIEKKLKRRLVWCVCLLHINELGPRHIIEELDGDSASGTRYLSIYLKEKYVFFIFILFARYKGVIGKLLSDVESLDPNPDFVVVNFGDCLLPDIPPDVEKELSSDQRHFRRLLIAVMYKRYPDGMDIFILLAYCVGPMSQARWITTFSRVLIVKMCHHDHLLDDTSKEILQILCQYIVSSFGPIFFLIKQKESWLEAPRHYLEMVKRLRLQDQRIQDIVQVTL